MIYLSEIMYNVFDKYLEVIYEAESELDLVHIKVDDDKTVIWQDVIVTWLATGYR